MNRRRGLASALAVGLVLLAAPAAQTQTDADLDGDLTVEDVSVPMEVAPEPGGTASIDVEAAIAGADLDQAGVEASLHADGERVSSTSLEQAGDGTWRGELALPHTTPPGVHEVRVEAGQAQASEHLRALSLVAVDLSPDRLDFGSAGPNERLGPTPLTIDNLGNVPVEVTLAATPLAHEGEGDPIEPERLSVREDGDEVADLADPLDLHPLSVDRSRTLNLELHVPSGATQYVAPGDYAGQVTVEVQGVTR